MVKVDDGGGRLPSLARAAVNGGREGDELMGTKGDEEP